VGERTSAYGCQPEAKEPPGWAQSGRLKCHSLGYLAVIIHRQQLYLATVATAGYSRFDNDAKLAISAVYCGLICWLRILPSVPNRYAEIWPKAVNLLLADFDQSARRVANSRKIFDGRARAADGQRHSYKVSAVRGFVGGAVYVGSKRNSDAATGSGE